MEKRGGTVILLPLRMILSLRDVIPQPIAFISQLLHRCQAHASLAMQFMLRSLICTIFFFFFNISGILCLLTLCSESGC